MPARDPVERSPARPLPSIMLWAAVGLAAVVALLLLVGDGTGTLRFAMLLMLVVAVLLGASINLRASPGDVRRDMRQSLHDETDQLRRELRTDVSTAVRLAQRDQAERLRFLQEQVELLQGQLTAVRAGLTRAAAAAGAAVVEAPQPATTSGYDGPARYRSGPVTPDHPGTGYGPVTAPARTGTRAAADQRWSEPQDGPPEGAAYGVTGMAHGSGTTYGSGAAYGVTGTAHGSGTAYGSGAAYGMTGTTYGSNGAAYGVTHRAGYRSAPAEPADRTGTAGGSPATGTIPTQRSGDQGWPTPITATGADGRYDLSGGDEHPYPLAPGVLRHTETVSVTTRHTVVGHAGLAGAGQPRAVDPAGAGSANGHRTADPTGWPEPTGGQRVADPAGWGPLDGRWAASAGNGHEVRLGERRTSVDTDATGTRIRIEDRWAAVRRSHQTATGRHELAGGDEVSDAPADVRYGSHPTAQPAWPAPDALGARPTDQSSDEVSAPGYRAWSEAGTWQSIGREPELDVSPGRHAPQESRWSHRRAADESRPAAGTGGSWSWTSDGAAAQGWMGGPAGQGRLDEPAGHHRAAADHHRAPEDHHWTGEPASPVRRVAPEAEFRWRPGSSRT